MGEKAEAKSRDESEKIAEELNVTLQEVANINDGSLALVRILSQGNSYEFPTWPEALACMKTLKAERTRTDREVAFLDSSDHPLAEIRTRAEALAKELGVAALKCTGYISIQRAPNWAYTAHSWQEAERVLQGMKAQRRIDAIDAQKAAREIPEPAKPRRWRVTWLKETPSGGMIGRIVEVEAGSEVDAREIAAMAFRREDGDGPDRYTVKVEALDN
jgi:hypothetical protein